MRWLLTLLTCVGECEREPSPVTSVMSAAALGFAVSAHYDARAVVQTNIDTSNAKNANGVRRLRQLDIAP
ncbi:hypothetical protein [Burkholderia multivorans]|uniref:hypothetical protein n=1 Tax=Burkholderia multivorans TaxID=87883 RepID=UPI001C25009A|nr:hypothetical protein [Burkholderia multivorans]MBU9223471.1 hypothetical protein [Burkholderia multivorans]MBU9418075.1 hypothetical protein [Burkholderia multivorans]MBU9478766.1 hypothetical protein [Burkholderia multivorans]